MGIRNQASVTKQFLSLVKQFRQIVQQTPRPDPDMAAPERYVQPTTDWFRSCIPVVKRLARTVGIESVIREPDRPDRLVADFDRYLGALDAWLSVFQDAGEKQLRRARGKQARLGSQATSDEVIQLVGRFRQAVQATPAFLYIHRPTRKAADPKHNQVALWLRMCAEVVGGHAKALGITPVMQLPTFDGEFARFLGALDAWLSALLDIAATDGSGN